MAKVSSDAKSRQSLETRSRPRGDGGNGRERRKIALALQGGGSHGAFTWGALDRLLEEPSLEIVGISGTSAGAMNAAVLADGLRRGGHEGARAALRNYWRDVGDLPGLASLLGPQFGHGTRVWHFDYSPIYLWLDLLNRVLSPYQTNVLNYHPLRAVLERIDFAGLRSDAASARVFIAATNVRTGLRRLFTNEELSVDVLLASACLPDVFQAVEIDGEPYWDGGYSANPALSPLYLRTDATDVVIFGINPLLRETVPKDARAIVNRVNEISFNSTFMLELAAIAFIDDLIDEAAIEATRYKRLLIHKIEDYGSLSRLGASSKMNNDPRFLHRLHAIGRNAADNWLKAHLDDVGKQSTVDLTPLLPLREGFAARPLVDTSPALAQLQPAF
jgi:NTE family protein